MMFRYDPSSEMSAPVLESSGQLADKAVFTPDAMNSAKLQVTSTQASRGL